MTVQTRISVQSQVYSILLEIVTFDFCFDLACSLAWPEIAFSALPITGVTVVWMRRIITSTALNLSPRVVAPTSFSNLRAPYS